MPGLDRTRRRTFRAPPAGARRRREGAAGHKKSREPCRSTTPCRSSSRVPSSVREHECSVPSGRVRSCSDVRREPRPAAETATDLGGDTWSSVRGSSGVAGPVVRRRRRSRRIVATTRAAGRRARRRRHRGPGSRDASDVRDRHPKAGSSRPSSAHRQSPVFHPGAESVCEMRPVTGASSVRLREGHAGRRGRRIPALRLHAPPGGLMRTTSHPRVTPANRGRQEKTGRPGEPGRCAQAFRRTLLP